MKKEVLRPKWPNMKLLQERNQEAKEKSASNYNRTHGARELPNIRPGSSVRIKAGSEKLWSEPSQIIKPHSDRSYLIRNRRNLQLCPHLDIRMEEEPETSKPSETSNPREKTTHFTLPLSNGLQTRSGRTVKPVQRYGTSI